MLIVLEGLDGSGKSTQVNRLREYLAATRGNVEYIHFPRYGSGLYGDLIGKFLRGGFGGLGSVHPQLVALLYAEDRHAAAPGMRAALDQGKMLLLDRYVYSNIAFQCAKMDDGALSEELRQWIFDTEYGDFALPKPDLNIFLDTPVSFIGRNLSSSRSGDGDRDYLHGARDIHEADLEFQKKVRRMYLRQAELDPSFVVVDCAGPGGEMLPPDAIFAKIKAVVDEKC